MYQSHEETFSKEIPKNHFQEPLKNKEGALKSMEYMLPTPEDKIKKGYIVRVLKFIPGKILFDVSPWTAEHFFQAGKFVAKMDKELQVGKRDLCFSSE